MRVIKYIRGLVLSEDHVYIGRKFGPFKYSSKWANPFMIGKDGTRIEVVEKYKKYILNTPKLISDLHELKNKILVCWCGGRDVGVLCHGDVLVELTNEVSK